MQGTSDAGRTLAHHRSILRLAGSICGVTTGEAVVGLTFDDGPSPGTTEDALGLLQSFGMHATFFVVVSEALRHRSLLNEVGSEGHEIALHGVRHVDLTCCSIRQVWRSVLGGRATLEDLAQQPVRFFRPPYGTENAVVHGVARLAALEVVGWSASPRDFYDLELERHLSIVGEEIGRGGIVLLHDGASAGAGRRAELHRGVLELVRARGCDGLSVGGLLAGREIDRRLRFRRRDEALLGEVAPLLR